MRIRRAREGDLSGMLEIVEQAREDLGKRGIDQWQNGYPNREVLARDIAKGRAYVLEAAGRVGAMAAISFERDPSYETILGGAWLTDGPSAVVHRLAVARDLRGQGLAAAMMAYAGGLCAGRGAVSVKVDTHRHNAPMRRLLEKLEYSHCGTVLLADGGGQRVAYEKMMGQGG